MERMCRGTMDRDGNVLTGAKCVMGRWKDSFDEPMNEENERENVQLEKLPVWIRKYLIPCMQISSDDTPMEVRICLGKVLVEFLAGS